MNMEWPSEPEDALVKLPTPEDVEHYGKKEEAPADKMLAEMRERILDADATVRARWQELNDLRLQPNPSVAERGRIEELHHEIAQIESLDKPMYARELRIEAKSRGQHHFAYPMLTRYWNTNRELWSEARLLKTQEEVQSELQLVHDQLTGCQSRREEVQTALRNAPEESEDTEILEAELEELDEQIEGLTAILAGEDLEGSADFIVYRDFRRYIEEEAHDESQKIQSYLRDRKDSSAADYDDAENTVAQNFVDELLEEGNGWHAIGIAVESGIPVDEDMVMAALQGIESLMDEAREARNITQLRRLEAEVKSIEQWQAEL